MSYRVVRFAGSVTRNVFVGVLKTFVTFLIFCLAAMMTMRYLGLPVPSPWDLLRSFEGLSKLAKLLG